MKFLVHLHKMLHCIIRFISQTRNIIRKKKLLLRFFFRNYFIECYLIHVYLYCVHWMRISYLNCIHYSDYTGLLNVGPNARAILLNVAGQGCPPVRCVGSWGYLSREKSLNGLIGHRYWYVNMTRRKSISAWVLKSCALLVNITLHKFIYSESSRSFHYMIKTCLLNDSFW